MIAALALLAAPQLPASVIPIGGGRVFATIRNPGTEPLMVWTGSHAWNIELRDAKHNVIGSTRGYREGGLGPDGTLYHAPHFPISRENEWVRLEGKSSLSMVVPAYDVRGPLDEIPARATLHFQGVLDTSPPPLPDAWKGLPVVSRLQTLEPTKEERTMAARAWAGVRFRPGYEELGIVRSGRFEALRKWRSPEGREVWQPSPSGRYLYLSRPGRASVYDLLKVDEEPVSRASIPPTGDWGGDETLRLVSRDDTANPTWRVEVHGGDEWSVQSTASFRTLEEYAAGIRGWPLEKARRAVPAPIDANTLRSLQLAGLGFSTWIQPFEEARVTALWKDFQVETYHWETRATLPLTGPPGELRFLRWAGPNLVSVTGVRFPEMAKGHAHGSFELTSAFTLGGKERHTTAIIDVKRRHTLLLPELTAAVAVIPPSASLPRPTRAVDEERIERAVKRIGIAKGDTISIEWLPEAMKLRKLQRAKDDRAFEVVETRTFSYADEASEIPRDSFDSWGDRDNASSLAAVLRALRTKFPQFYRGRHIVVQMVEKGERDLWSLGSVHEGMTAGRITMQVDANGKGSLFRAMRHRPIGVPIRGL